MADATGTAGATLSEDFVDRLVLLSLALQLGIPDLEYEVRERSVQRLAARGLVTFTRNRFSGSTAVDVTPCGRGVVLWSLAVTLAETPELP